jgi:hypothetical protein
MKKILLFTIASSLLLLTSCHIIKTVKVLKQGEVVQKNFLEQVSFESRVGLIILNVKVNGHDYNFIFDSGAVNCVTKEVAKELALKPVINQKAEDSEGKTGGIQFAILDELQIGKISFKNTSAAIIDLQAVPELACLKVDGLVGANLMRKLFWQLDYLKQTVTFSDHLDSLHVPKNAYNIPFKPELSGTPVVEVELDGMKSKGNIFDTGSSGAVSLSGPTFRSYLEKHADIKYGRGFGSNSAGLYGAGTDTTYAAKLNLRMGSLELKDQLVESKREKGNLGSDFFRDYVVTMDWKNQKMYFVSQGAPAVEWETFGFSTNKQDKQLYVSFLYENSPAARAGLRRGDKIISIDGTRYDNMSSEDFCNLLVKPPSWKRARVIEVTYTSQDGISKTVQVERKPLLN